MTPRDVACRELVELVTEYLDGALPPEETAAVEAHLALCEGCARYLEQMRATIAAVGTVQVETLPDDAVDALLAAFRERR
ncbi:MAG TPA: zf-HC2 domain-containing protein [Pseudonocardia sp.]|nr:zf-HC2 domain-containing protein [Pseudonocardia sp.]